MKIILACRDLKMNHILVQGLKEYGLEVEQFVDLGEGIFRSAGPGDYLLIYDEPFDDESMGIDDWISDISTKIPVIVLTGNNPMTRKDAFALSSHIDYLMKPFKFSELLKRIWRIMNSPS